MGLHVGDASSPELGQSPPKASCCTTVQGIVGVAKARRWRGSAGRADASHMCGAAGAAVCRAARRMTVDRGEGTRGLGVRLQTTHVNCRKERARSGSCDPISCETGPARSRSLPWIRGDILPAAVLGFCCGVRIFSRAHYADVSRRHIGFLQRVYVATTPFHPRCPSRTINVSRLGTLFRPHSSRTVYPIAQLRAAGCTR